MIIEAPKKKKNTKSPEVHKICDELEVLSSKLYVHAILIAKKPCLIALFSSSFSREKRMVQAFAFLPFFRLDYFAIYKVFPENPIPLKFRVLLTIPVV